MRSPRPYSERTTIPGTVYRVVRHIGAGGMGCVYDVFDTSIGKRYVLKTLHVDLFDRHDLAARMAKEARVLAQLSHPNIVDVVTAGVTGDELRLPYFVMEKLRGESLRTVIAKRGQLALEASVGIAIDLLDALDHAHGMGVVHRDVKPENIFVQRLANGHAITKLLDFGVMKLMNEQPSAKVTARCFVGTMKYAAPEQLTGGRITPRTDVYAAALVLYEMLAGQRPFDDGAYDDGRDDLARAAVRLHRPAPKLSPWIAVPRALDDVIAQALSIDPEQRPRDAFTFAARLRAHLRAIDRDGSTTQRTTVAALVTSSSTRAGETEIDDTDDATEITPAQEAATTNEMVTREARTTTVRLPTPPALAPPAQIPPPAPPAPARPPDLSAKRRAIVHGIAVALLAAAALLSATVISLALGKAAAHLVAH
jgi:serine/threonine-protein kinase